MGYKCKKPIFPEDMPWKDYYPNSETTNINVDETLYSNFTKTVQSIPDELAYIDYATGEKETYLSLYKNVEKFANALYAFGMRENSRIAFLSFNAKIDPVIILGANKLGVAVVFLSPEEGVAELEEYVQDSDMLLIEEAFLALEPHVNPCRKPVVVWGEKEHEGYLSFSSFIANGSTTMTTAVQANPERISLIIFSSGSTGKAKPILHSDYTIESVICKVQQSDYPINRKNFFIKVIPSHIGLGVVTTLLTSLIIGVPYIQMKGYDNPEVFINETANMLINFREWADKMNLEHDCGIIFFAAPIFAKFLLKKYERITDLSYIKTIMLGGSKMSKEELEEMEKCFSAKGLEVPVCIGYGQNELCGAVALNTVSHNKNGSAGYPVPGTKICVVDRETHEKLPCNKEGIILEDSDSLFLGYLNMEERTQSAYITLNDGTRWYNSTDIGYMDEDGYLWITGRTTRVVTKMDHKVSLDVVETKLRAYFNTSEIAVSPINTDGDTVIIYSDSAISENSVLHMANCAECGLSLWEMPVSAKYLPEIPHMNNGKIDYQKLKTII